MFIPVVFMNHQCHFMILNRAEQQLEGDDSSPAAHYFRSQCNKLVKNTSYSDTSPIYINSNIFVFFENSYDKCSARTWFNPVLNPGGRSECELAIDCKKGADFVSEVTDDLFKIR